MDPSSVPWVVIPTYNEADNIVKVIERVRKAAPQARVLVVDDSSPDGTAQVVQNCAAGDARVDVLMRPAKSGLGSAYRDGFSRGNIEGATALVEMDADLSHEPEVIPVLLRVLEDGYDLAIGSRYVPGGKSPGLSRGRLALSKGGNAYANLILGLGVRDATSGFRAFRPALLQTIDLATVGAEGYGFQIEMVFRAAILDARVAEVPIVFRERTQGVSKMSRNIVIEAMVLCTVWGAQRRARQLARKRGDFAPYRKGTDKALAAIIGVLRA